MLVRSGRVEVTNSTFTSLRAEAGGALALMANASKGQSADVHVSHSIFTSNQATQGGAAFVEGGKLTLLSSTLEANKATQEGGALFVSRGEAVLGSGTRLSANKALPT